MFTNLAMQLRTLPLPRGPIPRVPALPTSLIAAELESRAVCSLEGLLLGPNVVLNGMRVGPRATVQDQMGSRCMCRTRT
jgi:hypothetical protein